MEWFQEKQIREGTLNIHIYGSTLGDMVGTRKGYTFRNKLSNHVAVIASFVVLTLALFSNLFCAFVCIKMLYGTSTLF